MVGSSDKFQCIVRAVLGRFFAQVSRPIPSAQLSRIAAQLCAVIAERELPRPLAADECGVPGGMSEQECAPLVARVMEGVDNDPLVADAARQLVKACFYPEFKVCRDSFRELTRDGACRRQELGRARNRLSGSHCVDCPHWVALTPDEHAGYLVQEWRGNPEEFTANCGIFLPEDFRALRRWLYFAARVPRNAEKDSSAQ